jgi:hypothetical protein
MGYSMESGVPVQLVPNDGGVDEAVDSMVTAVDRLESV